MQCIRAFSHAGAKPSIMYIHRIYVYNALCLGVQLQQSYAYKREDCGGTSDREPATQAKLVVLKDTGLYRKHLQVNANRDEFYLIDELQGNQLSRGELFYDQRTKEQAVPAKLQNGNWSPKATRQRQQFRLLIF